MYGAAFLVFLIVRIILAARSQETDQSLSVGSIFSAALRWVAGLVAVGVVLEQKSPELLPPIAIVLLPTAFIERLLVPLGVPFLPYWLTRCLRPWSARKENRAAAVFNELRARLRYNLLIGPERAARLAGPLLETQGARGYSVAGKAVLDALHGDLEQARALFNVGMQLRHATYGVRCYCHAWLMVDAAGRGRYAELLRLTERGPFSFRRAFLRACAEQMLSTKQHSKLWLGLLWLAAPGRAAARSLLRACWSRKPLQLEPLADDFSAARNGAAELVSAPAGLLPRSRIRQVAASWQGVFDDGTLRRQLLERMTQLDSGFDLDDAVASVETQVIGLLSAAWQAAPSDEDDSEDEAIGLLLAARDRAQDELLSELESLTSSLETGDAKGEGAFEPLFRRWAQIRWTAQRYLELFPERSEFFYDNFGTVLLNHGAWVHNRESAYALSCDIFRWLQTTLPAGHEDLTLLKGNERLSHTAADR